MCGLLSITYTSIKPFQKHIRKCDFSKGLKEYRLQSQNTWPQTPGLAPASATDLGKSFNNSVPLPSLL